MGADGQHNHVQMISRPRGEHVEVALQQQIKILKDVGNGGLGLGNMRKFWRETLEISHKKILKHFSMEEILDIFPP